MTGEQEVYEKAEKYIYEVIYELLPDEINKTKNSTAAHEWLNKQPVCVYSHKTENERLVRKGDKNMAIVRWAFFPDGSGGRIVCQKFYKNKRND